MATKSELFVCRFLLDNNKRFYFRSVWGVDNFVLDATDGRYVWRGEANHELIATRFLRGISIDDFLRLSKNALTTQDLSKKKFSYKIVAGEKLTDLEFTWNFKLGTSDKPMWVQCPLPLIRVSDGQHAQQTMQQILDYLIDKRDILQRQNIDFSRLNEKLVVQRNEAISQFSKLVADKKALETDLYKKFVLVLNEKKNKIRELKEAIESMPLTKSPSQSPTNSDSGLCDKVDKEGKDSRGSGREDEAHPTSSLTWNIHTKATPSLDLLDSEEAVISTTVRKRHRPDAVSNSTILPATPKKNNAHAPPIASPKHNPSGNPSQTPSTKKRRAVVDSASNADDLIDALV